MTDEQKTGNEKAEPKAAGQSSPEAEQRRRSVPQHLSSFVIKSLLDTIELKPSFFGLGIDFKAIKEFLRGRGDQYRKTVEERKLDLIRELLELDVDPEVFDVLLQNETDRRLKVRFGCVFLFLTFLFTTASYGIVVLDGVYEWNISQVAITSLIIETPIQFVGLLYIIARNLFPQTEAVPQSRKRRSTEQERSDDK